MYYVLYGFLYLVSLLPFTILYVISDVIYVVLYHLTGYRKETVMNNLLIAFPEKSLEERKLIAKRFYKNLADTFVETVKMCSMSKKTFLKRCKGNFEVVHELISKGKNIQLHASHQFNWEYANWIFTLNMQLPFGSVYMPLNNKAFNQLYLKIRGRFGSFMIDATQFTKSIFAINRKQHVLALIADQNPGMPERSYWLNFFNKPVPFLIGPEKSAVRNNTAVVFVNFYHTKRGHYFFESTLITENAGETDKGGITRQFRDFIEDCIRKRPDNYLWSHRRWRHEYKEGLKKLWVDNDSYSAV